MFSDLKSWAKSALPGRLQVPVKYWFSAMNGDLEVELRHLPELVQPGDRVIDVGGNRGIYTYRFWKLGATVEVFEPNPECADLLREWSKGKSRIRIHQAALSDHNAVADLRIPVDEHGIEHDSSASLEARPEGRFRSERVQLTTLDSYGMTDGALIKIDTEGHEGSVISGALQTLSAAHPILIVEIEQRHLSSPITQAFSRIADLGYEGHFFEAGKLKPLKSFSPDVHQALSNFKSGQDYYNNFIFLPKEGRLRERSARFVARHANSA